MTEEVQNSGAQSPDATGVPAGTPATPAITADELAALRRQAAQAAASQSRADKLEADLKRFADAERAAQLAAAGDDGRAAAELEIERKRAADLEKQLRVMELKSKYPQALEVLGEDAAALSEERLAAVQSTIGSPIETPTPEFNNGSRTAAQAAVTPAKPKTSAELLAELATMPMPENWFQMDEG